MKLVMFHVYANLFMLIFLLNIFFFFYKMSIQVSLPFSISFLNVLIYRSWLHILDVSLCHIHTQINVCIVKSIIRR